MNLNLWARLLRRGGSLGPQQRARLDAWRALPEPDLRLPYERQRFVVVDVESTGLDVLNDRLIAIGAVTVTNARIALDDAFYRVLRQERASSHGNILVHGIGGTSQTQGDDPLLVLLDFLEYVGKSPMVGFHAQFDDIMIRKASRQYLGEKFRRSWIDLAYLGPALGLGSERNARSLDDWLELSGISNYSRHDALADALATAQLFQVMAVRAAVAGGGDAKGFLESARGQQWLDQQSR